MNKKCAVVVGAGKSLGAFLAKHLAENNYNVVVADINLDNAEKVAKEINVLGYNAIPIYVDATCEESVKNLFEEIEMKYITIDLMVYNAGVAISSKITEFQKKDFDFIIDVNLNGYFLTSKYAAKLMIKNSTKGRIIQINSKSGKVGSKYNSAYSSAKFGGVGLTQSLALDLAEHEITVNSLMLGNLLNSDMFESLIPQYAVKLDIPESQVKQFYMDKVPLARGCEFIDVAEVLLFYSSEKASYCTGQSIDITGGQVMF